MRELGGDGVAGDLEEPGGEAGAALGIVAMDLAGESHEGLLRHVPDRIRREAPVAEPLHHALERGSEHVPELEPGRVVSASEPLQKLGIHGSQGPASLCVIIAYPRPRLSFPVGGIVSGAEISGGRFAIIR